jgi:hypothetical protein
MISRLINRPCQLVRLGPSGTEDDSGNEIDGETVVTTVCEIQMFTGQATEPSGHNEMSRTKWSLFLPVGTDIDSGDSVIVDGKKYELDGDAWAVRDPLTGRMSHVEASLILTAGAYDGESS